jgi:hypothetical protein
MSKVSEAVEPRPATSTQILARALEREASGHGAELSNVLQRINRLLPTRANAVFGMELLRIWIEDEDTIQAELQRARNAVIEEFNANNTGSAVP